MKLVGVTSCIAGLAHTPMAARALENAGGKLGYTVNIEQQGAMGTIDELTLAQITAADIVLIASDRTIEGEDRFDGKKIVRVKIGQCVSSAEAVLKKIKDMI
ncbi:PTS fructose transporter subunit IIB [Erysipelotrichaceae bacterium]|nr:PTS fructose transporter subunit IIB [Erysipelotrichaceae bacterium]